MESAAIEAPHATRRPTIGDRLEGARRRHFVGRHRELAVFTAALRAATPPVAVLYVYGPGGIGKTALLRRYAEVTRAEGRRPLWLDVGRCGPSRAGLMDGLCHALNLPDGQPPREALAAAGPAVLLVDGYETTAHADDWMREELLSGLPADVLVVLAGRLPPGDGWRADAAWAELVAPVRLANLPAEDGAAYLTAAGVPAELHQQMIAASHGHPLALSLLADARDRGVPSGTGLTCDPGLVRLLLERFIAVVPSLPQREALEGCALTRAMTESTLREVLKTDDAAEVFRWLRGLSFVEEGDHGLTVHELARDLIDADLRWRDPTRHGRLLRRLLRIISRTIPTLTGPAQERLFLDLLYLSRTSPALAGSFVWDAVGQVRVEPFGPADRAEMIAMTKAHEGPTSATLAAFWLDRQPEAFCAFRRHGKMLGYCCYLRLDETDPADRDADPATRAAWAFTQRFGPARETEHVTLLRFMMDAQTYQSASAALNLRAVVTGRNWFGNPRLSWDFFAVHDGYPQYDEFGYIDYHRAPEADFTVDEQRYIVFAHDWRRRPLAAWGHVMEERGLIREVVAPDRVGNGAELVLSQPEFEEAVRAALRNVTRPALLAGNPLLRSQVVRRAKVGAGTPTALAAKLRGAVDGLRANPRGEKLYRVLERTYLRPAKTQELAAESLDLPFSTYRRHLTQGVQAVASRMWHDELYGGADPPTG